MRILSDATKCYHLKRITNIFLTDFNVDFATFLKLIYLFCQSSATKIVKICFNKSLKRFLNEPPFDKKIKSDGTTVRSCDFSVFLVLFLLLGWRSWRQNHKHFVNNHSIPISPKVQRKRTILCKRYNKVIICLSLKLKIINLFIVKPFPKVTNKKMVRHQSILSIIHTNHSIFKN